MSCCQTQTLVLILQFQEMRIERGKKIGLICHTTSAARVMTAPRNKKQQIIITRPTAFQMLLNSIMIASTVLYLLYGPHSPQEHKHESYFFYPHSSA